ATDRQGGTADGHPVPAGPAAFVGAGARGQDTNFNFVAGAYDRNENWSQAAPGTRAGGSCSQSENMTNPSDNLDAAQGPTGDGARLCAAVRSPPEGAEVGGPGDEAAAAEEAAEERGKPLSSPAEDNGYASSSLSIDSPDSVSGSAWEPPAAAHVRESPAEPGVADPGTETSPDTDALFPALAEAFQHIQDKERFKEREKEKHHIQLVMYRRLALLRWIHSLQQKVVAQQNRLQESFDTILDNRKELIRHLQQGLACPGAPGRPGL
uniref:Chromosome 1 open reading frame 216 n=1 Tax=Dromaius novaehollandiae TaxID=8790 RepID=A0A8C4PAZ6_DRONO